MKIEKEMIMSFENFNSLSNDIIELAKGIFPDKAIYINLLNNQKQVTLKVSKHDTKLNILEGNTIPFENAVCSNIDFTNNNPLILENAKENNFNESINEKINDSNMGSYLAIPIVFKNEKRFGALCASHHDESKFDLKDIELLKKVANLFSYYLELEQQAYMDTLTGLENKRYLLLKQSDIIKKRWSSYYA